MNELDELVGPTWDEGRDIRVIDRQLPVMIGFGSILFEVLLWLLVIPGIIFLFMKIAAVMGRVDAAFGRIFPQVEAYPELRAHAAISDAMR